MAQSPTDLFISELRKVTSDGYLSGDEVWQLAKWLNEHSDAMKVWPGSLFVEPLNEAFADGILDNDEMVRIGTLIREVEREWSLQSAPVQEDTSLVTEETEISVLELPVIDSSVMVPSSSRPISYKVDLFDNSCTCEDWRKNRSEIPVNNLNRCCKHIAQGLLEVEAKGVFLMPDYLRAIAEECVQRDRGINPRSQWVVINLPEYRKEDPVLVSWDNSPWCNVYAPAGVNYERYGYNCSEVRWAYGLAPNRGRRIARAIHQLLKPAGDLDYRISSQQLSPEEQSGFLHQFGFDTSDMSPFETELLFTRVLRPVTNAISKTFKHVHAIEERHKETLQNAILRSDFCRSLPRYGPYSKWEEMEIPDRSLTKEERMKITDLAFGVLPPEVFLALESNGIKKYKADLDVKLKDSY
ncbi:MAG: hypothetical protein WCO56_06130 [Verrucomicrobiota bacterium]